MIEGSFSVVFTCEWVIGSETENRKTDNTMSKKIIEKQWSTKHYTDLKIEH